MIEITREKAKAMLTEINSVGDFWSHEFIVDMIFDSRELEDCKNCKHKGCAYKQAIDEISGYELKKFSCSYWEFV